MSIDPSLSSNFRRSAILNAIDAKDRTSLVAFFEERHEERFFQQIENLRSQPRSGFAMMSLCCLLIETLECYRQGLPTSYQKEISSGPFSVPAEFHISSRVDVNSKNCFVKFFKDYSSLFKGIDGLQFYQHIRCGLLHQSQTKAGWTLNVEGSEVWDGKTNINRSIFAVRLKECFKLYVTDLRFLPDDHETWQFARRKLWWLCSLS